MHFKFFLLLLVSTMNSWAQTPFTNFLKKYVETKGIEVEHQNMNNQNLQGTADKPKVIYAAMKTVTVDDEYPRVLKAFRRNLEGLLTKSYTLVSFTKDADNEDINKVYKFIKDSTVEMVHYQKEEDQVTLHVFEMVFRNMKEAELKNMPLTIDVNQGQGRTPMNLNLFPLQQGNQGNQVVPKTDTTKKSGQASFR
ncbi:MAG TPA: hypothetical protein VGE06_10470 [Flavisolibacter sp.]